MRIVQTLAVGDDDVDVVSACIAFHLHAGVDLVVTADTGLPDAAMEALEAFVKAGRLRRVAVEGKPSLYELHTRLARTAVAEHDADWVLPTTADELWWPRAESLADVLAAIPPRYQIVQALVRDFAPTPDDGRFFAERMTARTSLASPAPYVPPLEWALRRAYRGSRHLVVEGRDQPTERRLVPARGWYPIEVLRFPVRSPEQAELRLSCGIEVRSRLEAELLGAYRQGTLARRYDELAAGIGPALESGELVEDVRVAEALRSLRRTDPSTGAEAFALPGAAAPGPIAFDVPDVVDDAAYAVECAALGETDTSELARHVDELERRIVELESAFWPRVTRRLARLVARFRG